MMVRGRCKRADLDHGCAREVRAVLARELEGFAGVVVCRWAGAPHSFKQRCVLLVVGWYHAISHHIVRHWALSCWIGRHTILVVDDVVAGPPGWLFALSLIPLGCVLMSRGRYRLQADAEEVVMFEGRELACGAVGLEWLLAGLGHGRGTGVMWADVKWRWG